MQSDLVGLHACCGVLKAEFCQHIFGLVGPLFCLHRQFLPTKKVSNQNLGQHVLGPGTGTLNRHYYRTALYSNIYEVKIFELQR